MGLRPECQLLGRINSWKRLLHAKKNGTIRDPWDSVLQKYVEGGFGAGQTFSLL